MSFGVQNVGFTEPSEIIANIVIIEGNNAGLFVYNGTPSLGNPPILSITDSTVDPYGNTVTPSLSLSGLPELFYSGAPMLGNLIAAISGQAGTDEFGNTYVQGAQFGSDTSSQIQLIPSAGNPISVTSAIGGILEGIANLTTTDDSEAIGGILGAAILGSGATSKMTTFLSSPIGGNILNTNANFNEGISGWSGNNGAAVTPSTLNPFGSSQGSMLITPNGVTSGPNAGTGDEYVAVQPSVTYSYVAQVFSPQGWATGGGCQLGINWYTAAGVFISSSFSGFTAIPANTYTELSESVTSPSTAAFAQLFVSASSTPPATTLFYVGLAALSGPASQGMALLLSAENDGGTDESWAMLGTISTPDDTTIVFNPVLWITPYAIVLYSGASGITVVTKTSGSGNIAIPANALTTGKGECGAPGGGGATAASFGAAAAGGGEYAAEPNLAITPGGNVGYVVGTPGMGGINGGAASASGGNVTLTGTSVTVTAHGGIKGTSTGTPGNGGSGSTNTVHENGGNGGTTIGGEAGGGGGGSGAGPSAPGNNGQEGKKTGGIGGIAPSGGGDGGNGGANGGPGLAGAFPGGGGGGSGAGGNGANGASGYAKLTYSTGAPTVIASLVSATITDPFGTSIKAGTILPGPADTNQYNSGPLILNATATPQTINSTGTEIITGCTAPVIATTYDFRAVVQFKANQAAGTAQFGLTGPADTSPVWISGFFMSNTQAGGGAQAAGLNPVASPTFAAVTEWSVIIEGTVAFTAAGTVALVASCSNSSDTFRIDNAKFWLTPTLAVAG